MAWCGNFILFLSLQNLIKHLFLSLHFPQISLSHSYLNLYLSSGQSLSHRRLPSQSPVTSVTVVTNRFRVSFEMIQVINLTLRTTILFAVWFCFLVDVKIINFRSSSDFIIVMFIRRSVSCFELTFYEMFNYKHNRYYTYMYISSVNWIIC